MRPRLPVLLAAATAAVTVAATAPATSPASAADDDRRRRIDSSIAAVREDLAETSRDLRVAVERLNRVEAELTRVRQASARVQGQLRAATAEEARLAGALRAATRRVQQTRRDIAEVAERTRRTRLTVSRVARAAYQQGPLRELALYLRAESPDEFVDRVAYTRSALRDRDALLDDLAAQDAALEDRERALAEQQSAIAELRSDARANVTRIRGLERQVTVWQLSTQRLAASRRAARARLAQQRSVELGRLNDMEREAASLSALLAARAGVERGWRGDGGRALSMPAAGPLTSPFGMRVHPITGRYKLHDGIDLGGGCDAPVYAAASGFVLESRSAPGWGNRIVIEHGVKRGSDVAASYNHLSRRLVDAGDYVYRGQVIGRVGSTGLSTGCHLHFTVYDDGDRVDPLRWL